MMKHKTLFLVLFLVIIFLVGCENDQFQPTTNIQNSQSNLIEKLVEKSTNIPSLQEEMKKELEFLIMQNILRIEDVKIDFNEFENDFYYQFNGDQMVPRRQVKEYMNEYSKPSASFRSHRKANSFVNAGTYTIYVHSSVPSAWLNAVTAAYTAWNGLNLTVKFGGASSTKTYNAGAITVYMKNISGAFALTPDPSGGKPGYQIIIDTDSTPLSSSQKKVVMAHEIGHALGFKHTDTNEGTALTSTNYNCISTSCNGDDGNSIMKNVFPVPSWAGFSVCDKNIFSCIY